jgi:hypothetical protein
MESRALRSIWSAAGGAFFSGAAFACIWLMGQALASGQIDVFFVLAGGSGLTLIYCLAAALPVTVTVTLAYHFEIIRPISAILWCGAGVAALTIAWFFLLPTRPGLEDPVIDNPTIMFLSSFVAGCVGGAVVANCSRKTDCADA